MPISPRPPSGTKTSSSGPAKPLRLHGRRGCGAEGDLAGGDRAPRPGRGADHELAGLVDGLEDAAHHLAVEADRDRAAEAGSLGQPELADAAHAAAPIPDRLAGYPALRERMEDLLGVEV